MITLENTKAKLLSRILTPEEPWKFFLAILSKTEPSLSRRDAAHQPFKPRMIGTVGLSYHSILAPPDSTCEVPASEIALLDLQWSSAWQSDTPQAASQPPVQRYSEIGYGIHSSFQGQGYASEAVPVFVQKFWEMPRFSAAKVLIPRTSTENLQSQRILLKCGARRWAVLSEGIKVPKLKAEGAEEEMVWEDVLLWMLVRPGLLATA